MNVSESLSALATITDFSSGVMYKWCGSLPVAMRFFFGPGGWIDHTDIAIQRIEDKHGSRVGQPQGNQYRQASTRCKKGKNTEKISHNGAFTNILEFKRPLLPKIDARHFPFKYHGPGCVPGAAADPGPAGPSHACVSS